MSEHTFKVGDLVRTKPMKVSCFDKASKGILIGANCHFYYEDELEPLTPIKPDSDAVEAVARIIDPNAFKDWGSETASQMLRQNAAKEIAAKIITALEAQSKRQAEG